MVRLMLTCALVAAPLCSAAAPEDFFRAIRADKTSELQRLIQAGPVNAPDGRGTTPLHYAAAFGSVESLKMLLAAGADVRARNAMQATPLLLAADSPAKVRMLLAAGAEPDACTKSGRSASTVAAARTGGIETVRMLVEAGADVKRSDERGITALLAASWYGDLETVRFLLARGADAKVTDKSGMSALLGPLAIHEPERARLLLQAGADVNAANTFAGKVRHGNIALTGLTPLWMAASDGSRDVVDLLLRAGAEVDRPDGRGLTPLMAAVASEHQEPRLLKRLIAAGANVNASDSNSETVLDWARKSGYPSTLWLLQQAGAKGKPVQAAPTRAGAPVQASRAIEQAMALLQTSSAKFFEQSGCIGCHHQTMTVQAETAARRAGMPVAPSVKQDHASQMNAVRTVEPVLLQFYDPGGEVDSVATHVLSFAAAGIPADSLTDAGVRYIAGKQDRSGAWMYFGISRVPFEDSNITRTALAIKTLKECGWPARQAEFDEKIAKGQSWLMHSKPATSYERADLLLGLHWSGAAAPILKRTRQDLLDEQRADGGWGQNPNLASDAYTTGLALYALRETGQLKETEAPYQRGVQYLLRTQLDDGSWHVRSRTPKFQPYFQSGFPHDHDQWISAAGTAYAVMALAPAAATPRVISRR